MDWWSRGVVVAFLTLVPIGSAPQPRGTVYPHVGMIVNADSRAGIEAEAYAYASKSQPQGGPDCPVYDKPLSRQRSLAATGAFTFLIETTIATYVAVYCQNGYAYRVEEINDNKTARSPVLPAPVALLPLRRDGPAGVDPTVMRRAIDRLIELAARDLRYFSGADRDAFATAAKDLPADDRAVAEILLKRAARVAALGQQP